jgi:hypothetical protein
MRLMGPYRVTPVNTQPAIASGVKIHQGILSEAINAVIHSRF